MAVLTLAGRGRDGRLKQYITPIGLAALMVCMAIGVPLTAYYNDPVPVVVAALVGLYLLFSIKVADQWQRVAVLRLGRYIGLRGPGMFHVIPVVDRLSRYVDQRIRVANVTAESTSGSVIEASFSSRKVLRRGCSENSCAL